MSANAHAAYDTRAEDEARAKMLAEWGIHRADADVIPMRRGPLGLRPSPVDEPERDDAYLGPKLTAEKLVGDALANLSAEARAAPASMEDLFTYALGMALERSFENSDEFRDRLRAVRREIADDRAGQRIEVAELKVTIAELRAEITAMRAVQEAARASSRGERGEQGPRGIPGSQGPPGPRGERGEAGVKAAGFVLDIEGYAATLVSSDGAPAARLALRPMFERFAEEIAADGD